MREAYNGDKYVSHFYCPDTHLNFTSSCMTKMEFKLTFRADFWLVKNQWGYDVKVFRLDGESSLIQECQNLPPYTPEQNGVVERSGGVIIIKARALGLEASLPTNLWPETVVYARYIANRTSIRHLGWKSPFEAVNTVKPSYDHLKIFGYKAYILDKCVPKSRKLDPRAHLGHLVGVTG